MQIVKDILEKNNQAFHGKERQNICEGHRIVNQQGKEVEELNIEGIVNYNVFITFLNLSNNKLLMLPKALFTELQHLRRINLSNNLLLEIPNTIQHCKRLQYLAIDDNNMKNIPTNLKDCKELRFLDISRNVFEEIPQSVTEIEGLETFCASHMFIEKLPSSIARLVRLQHLHIQGNCFSNLPESMSHLQNLSTLLVDGVPWSRGYVGTQIFSKDHFKEYILENGISRWLDAHGEVCNLTK